MTYEWKVPENLHSCGMTHEWKVPENLQRSMSFLRKFTWTLLHAPPHPTRAYMHLQAATEMHVLPPQVHMNVITCPTPPHPSPPMCTKHHGLLKAVVQLCLDVSMSLSIYLSMYVCIYLSMYLSIYLCMYVSIYLSIYVSIYLSIYLI